MQSLRKKYDGVIAYTVHLTAERDALMARLEGALKKIDALKSAKPTADTSSHDKPEKIAQSHGISLFVTFLFAILAFFLGRFWLQK